LTLFLVACAAMLALGALVFVVPPRSLEQDDESVAQANLRWYRQREAELARDGDETLREDAQLRLLEDAADPPPAVAYSRSFRAWLLVPVLLALSCGLYVLLGAAPDVMIAQRLASYDDSTAQPQITQLMADIEARSQARPSNLHYMALLGRFYMGAQQYERARQVYERLLEQVPEDGQALAFVAQAEYLANGRQLTERARLRAEQSLAADPHQRTALSLLGMASFEQEQYRAAITYWQRLLATEPPNSEGARMIAQVIESARARLEGGAGPVAADATAAQAPAGKGVTVRVELPEGATIAPTDTVFVLARDAQSGSRMPIAVQRLSGSALPITLRLDDSRSMAGQKLSEAEAVIVAVQVSADGRPGEAGATWLGQLGPLTPSLSVEPLLITLAPNTPAPNTPAR
jgi:cytochrome c-type biogenesis protein CcmH